MPIHHAITMKLVPFVRDCFCDSMGFLTPEYTFVVCNHCVTVVTRQRQAIPPRSSEIETPDDATTVYCIDIQFDTSLAYSRPPLGFVAAIISHIFDLYSVFPSSDRCVKRRGTFSCRASRTACRRPPLQRHLALRCRRHLSLIDGSFRLGRWA